MKKKNEKKNTTRDIIRAWEVKFNFITMIGRLFRAHGEFCASHPWEVIVALLTLTACILTVDKSSENTSTARHRCQGWRDSCEGFEAEYNAADVILMTIVRCSAVLYSYYQFLNLHKFGSKYILGKSSGFFFFPQFNLYLFSFTHVRNDLLC